MTWSRVNNNISGFASSSSVSITLNTNGAEILVVYCSHQNYGAVVAGDLSDSEGNVYTPFLDIGDSSGTYDDGLFGWYCIDPINDAALQLTVTRANSYPTLSCDSYSTDSADYSFEDKDSGLDNADPRELPALVLTGSVDRLIVGAGASGETDAAHTYVWDPASLDEQQSEEDGSTYWTLSIGDKLNIDSTNEPTFDIDISPGSDNRCLSWLWFHEEAAPEPPDEAIDFIGAGAVANAAALVGTTGQSYTPHVSTAEDDLMILLSYRNDDLSAFNTPSGWTQIFAETESGGQDRQTALFYKVAGASEGSVTVTHTDTTAEQWSGVILTFRGADTTTPIDVTYVEASHHRALQNKTTPNVDAFSSITTVTNEAKVLAIETVTHDDITSDADPTGYTALIRNYGGAIDHRQFQVWAKQVDTAGVETPGAPAYTSNNTVAESDQFTIALRPAAEVGGGGIEVLRRRINHE